eukprot:m.8548 g.8548  ORF g.8548 m.8548 type:complete len:265 (-) comp5370_c0_seq2:355-1149(-)
MHTLCCYELRSNVAALHVVYVVSARLCTALAQCVMVVLKARSMIRHYLTNVDGIIFVVDAADGERLNESKEELKLMLSFLEEAVPLLILANKQDMEGALTPSKVAGLLDLVNLAKGLPWTVLPTTTTKPELFKAGVEWLQNTIAHMSTDKAVRSLVGSKVASTPTEEAKAVPQPSTPQSDEQADGSPDTQVAKDGELDAAFSKDDADTPTPDKQLQESDIQLPSALGDILPYSSRILVDDEDKAASPEPAPPSPAPAVTAFSQQ